MIREYAIKKNKENNYIFLNYIFLEIEEETFVLGWFVCCFSSNVSTRHNNSLLFFFVIVVHGIVIAIVFANGHILRSKSTSTSFCAQFHSDFSGDLWMRVLLAHGEQALLVVLGKGEFVADDIVCKQVG